MKLSYLVVLMLAAGMGVGQTAPDPIKSPIQRLRYDANKYHIHWYVRCSNVPDDESAKYDYIGRAWSDDHKDPPESVGSYIESGAYDYWAAFGATQEQAAYNLWLALQKSQNIIATHTLQGVITTKKRHILCKPPIGSSLPIPKELQ